MEDVAVAIHNGLKYLLKDDFASCRLEKNNTSIGSSANIFFGLKFVLSKKATKIEEIFTVYLTLCTQIKSMVKISSIFVAFLENMNF